MRPDRRLEQGLPRRISAKGCLDLASAAPDNVEVSRLVRRFLLSDGTLDPVVGGCRAPPAAATRPDPTLVPGRVPVMFARKLSAWWRSSSVCNLSFHTFGKQGTVHTSDPRDLNRNDRRSFMRQWPRLPNGLRGAVRLRITIGIDQVFRVQRSVMRLRSSPARRFPACQEARTGNRQQDRCVGRTGSRSCCCSATA